MAAEWSDRDLDRALGDVGVLPPADLTEIRAVLSRPGIDVTARRNVDGHCLIEVSGGPYPPVAIHHDGRVEIAPVAAL